MAEQAVYWWANYAALRPALLEWTGQKCRSVSYGGLANMASALAGHLQSIGVTRGDRVGVLRS
ncbi:MAG: AMP-dependent synthetase, partial [Pseudomonadota bacterium]